MKTVKEKFVVLLTENKKIKNIEKEDFVYFREDEIDFTPIYMNYNNGSLFLKFSQFNDNMEYTDSKEYTEVIEQKTKEALKDIEIILLNIKLSESSLKENKEKVRKI